MLIGQLAKRTETSERLLRYYERVGLLTSERQANGYREYDAAAVQTVGQIRTLLDAGLSTALIKQLLPCAANDGALSPCPGVLDKLRDRLHQLDERANELTRARETLRQAIATTEQA